MSSLSISANNGLMAGGRFVKRTVSTITRTGTRAIKRVAPAIPFIGPLYSAVAWKVQQEGGLDEFMKKNPEIKKAITYTAGALAIGAVIMMIALYYISTNTVPVELCAGCEGSDSIKIGGEYIDVIWNDLSAEFAGGWTKLNYSNPTVLKILGKLGILKHINLEGPGIGPEKLQGLNEFFQAHGGELSSAHGIFD